MPKMKIVKRKLADGSERTYRYRVKPTPVGTLGAIIEEYKRSPAWNRLSPGSRKNYEMALNKIKPMAAKAVTAIRKRHILQLRDAFKPGVGQMVVAVLSILLKFAHDRDYVEHNVATRIERPKMGEWSRWPDELLAHFLEHAPEPMRRAALLAVATGQRQGDLLRLRWDAYDGDGLTLVQQKTDEPVYIPLLPAVLAELDAWRREGRSVTVLCSKRGTPWTRGHFQAHWAAAIHAAKLHGKGLTFHGLRATAAAHLAEAGCSTHEIAAITGHRTLSMVQKYAKGAEQKRRARADVKKLGAVIPFPSRKRSENGA